MRRYLWLILLAVMLVGAGCADEGPLATLDEVDEGLDSLTPSEEAKLSQDLLPRIREAGSIDILVQVDPQKIFYQQIDPNLAAELYSDPAVIWKARQAAQEGAVIWKLTPEQAVIWKMSTDQAVIWKFTEQLKQDGVPVEETFGSIHTFKMHAGLDAVLDLAKMDEIHYITPDRDVEVSDVNLKNVSMGVSMANTRVNNVNFTGYTGAGIGIAILDSGTRKYHGDFDGPNGNRIVAKYNFTNEGTWYNVLDNYGHGLTVASLAAGNGKNSYDQGYSTTFEGVAPEADLIIAKVLDTNGAGTVSDVIAALDWVLSIKSNYNIRVVNMSLGLPPYDPWYNDPLCNAVENAVAQGLAVVVAAGNYGWYQNTKLYGSIASPGISPSAITVGASNMRDTAKRQNDANGDNDFVAIFSSRGPTSWTGDPKPDLVAPGVNVIGGYSWNSTLGSQYPDRVIDPCDYGATNCSSQDPLYFMMSGTSAAAPIVTGTVALMLEADPTLNPNTVKAILELTSQVLFEEGVPTSCYTDKDWRDDPDCVGLNEIEQGAGLLNVPGAIDLAIETDMSLGGLNPGDPWVPDPNIEPENYYTHTGETVIWGQGLVWTGGIVIGEDLWNVWQEPYQPGVIWGTGLVWTGGITIGEDPVWSGSSMSVWTSAFINPFTLGGSNGVLGGLSYDWDEEPDMSGESDDWFPEL